MRWISIAQTLNLSAAVEKKLQEAETRVRTTNTAIELWEKVFTEKDRKRLGGNLEKAFEKDRALKMWKALHGCTNVRAIIDIAFAVNFLTSAHREWLLRETGEIRDAEAAFEDSITRNDLVLNSHTREIFWKGELIELKKSHEFKWTFLWELARHAKAGLPVDHMTYSSENMDYVSKTKSELAKTPGFPIELIVLIERCGTGTQKLELPPEQIRLFEHHVGGEIREWTP